MIRETETDPTGTVLKTISYTFGTDELSQTTVNYTNGTPDVPVTLTFAHDGHGSVRALFDAAGAIAHVAGVLQLFSYDAYGSAIGFTPAQAASTLLYSGEQFDQHSQMQHLWARYDASSGRQVRVAAGGSEDGADAVEVLSGNKLQLKGPINVDKKQERHTL